MSNIIDFLKDVKIELSKVAWPTRDQLIKYTLVVLGMSLFIAVFLGTADFVFQWLLNTFILNS